MKKIRWGIVGPGAIANKFAQAIKNVDTAELVAVASRSLERGRTFAELYGIELVFDSYELMAASDRVDAVYVATPHPFHLPCTELFLKNKKHVLCEKPLCINANEVVRLSECAKSNGVFLMEAMWTRFLPAVIKAKEMVDSGVIGDVLGLEADFCYRSSPDEEAKLFENSLAGGSLLDVGVYALHFAHMFLGDSPELISAVAAKEFEVDTHTVMTLKYPSGAIASLSSATRVKKRETAYIYGTKGTLFFPSFYDAEEFELITDKDERRYDVPYLGNGFEEEIYECCRCIAEGKMQSDIHPLFNTLTVMKWSDEIRRQTGIVYPFDL